MQSALRTIVINIVVTLSLFMGLLFLTALLGDGYNAVKPFFPKKDKRAELPSYDDPDYARSIFRDQKGRIKDYVPFVEWRHSPHQSPTLNVDENGRRTHRTGRDNARDATTIGIFGGSTVWGTGVDDNGTISANFDDITRNYEVTNYGERAYTLMQNLIELVTLINRGLAPEHVVFYEGFNDVGVYCNRAMTTRLNSHIQEQRFQSALDRTAKQDYLRNMIQVPISFLKRIIIGKNRKYIGSCGNDPGRARAVAETFVRTMEMAQTLVSANGGRFHGFLQPHAYIGKPRVDQLNLEEPPDGPGAQFAAVYPIILQEMVARGHTWFTDLSRALDGDDYLLIDNVHINSKGNARIARLIRDSLD